MTIMQLMNEGGFIMYPLLIFSIITWSLALYKFVYLKQFQKDSTIIKNDLNELIGQKKLSELKYSTKNAPSLIQDPYNVIFDELPFEKQEIKDRLQRKLLETNMGLKKHIWLLGTIGSSSPFIGLFGTVVGVMDSFKSIGASGKSGFAVVSSGISEALIATAAGIIVAVIAVIFYNFFLTKINNISTEFQHDLEDTFERLNLAKRNN